MFAAETGAPSSLLSLVLGARSHLPPTPAQVLKQNVALAPCKAWVPFQEGIRCDNRPEMSNEYRFTGLWMFEDPLGRSRTGEEEHPDKFA